MFGHHEVRLGVGAAVTDRHGGVSTPPYAELNLADHVGDDPRAVEQNRTQLATALGGSRPLVTMRQVHGASVAVVDEAPAHPPEADALVTRATGLTLVVLVADCTPVLLWDHPAGVIAAVYAGRRGLAGGVLPAAIAVMCELDARPDRISALVGPGICPNHYEVPADMRDAVGALAPQAAATTSDGRPALDIRAGLLEQLRTAGVGRWTVMSQCTAESSDYYSFRRDGTTGRFAGLIWREP